MSKAKKPEWYGKVEQLLEDYEAIQSQIEYLEAGMLPSQSKSVVSMEGGQGTPESSETERYGIKRADSPERGRIKELEALQKAISDFTRTLTHEESQLYFLRYRQMTKDGQSRLKRRLSDQEIIIELGMEEREYYRKKYDMCLRAAKFLGYIEVAENCQ